VLTEVYYMTGSKEYLAPAQDAIRWLGEQQRASGAWGPGRDDPVTTCWAMQALGSAALGDVPFGREAWNRGLAYLAARADGEAHLIVATHGSTAGWFGSDPPSDRVVARVLAMDPAGVAEIELAVNAIAVGRRVNPDSGEWAAWNARTLAVLRSVPADRSLACEAGNAGGGQALILDTLTYQVCQRYANSLGSRWR
jgi:hypothetical protein